MTTLLRYELTPRARLSAGRSAQVLNSRDIHTVIPGTTVRGALGWTWWRSASHRFVGQAPQATFDTLFGAALQVRQAVPAPTWDTDKLARLEPMSWVRCKYPTPECPATWHDEVVSPRRQCPVCRGPLKSGRGWNVPQEWSVSATRTALVGGVAADEQLYARRALRNNGIALTGTLSVKEHLITSEAMEWLLTDKEIGVGGQLSTMGRCAWTCTKVDEPAEVSEAGDYSLRLLSPAILVDELGAPSLDLAHAVEQQVLAAGGTVTTGILRTRPVPVSTWHGVAGLPKPEDWAVEAGSVVALGNIDQVGLRALRSGVGIRRLEGYGTVSLVPVAALQRDDAPESQELTTAPTVKRESPSRPVVTLASQPPPRHTEAVSTRPSADSTPEQSSAQPSGTPEDSPPRSPVDLVLDNILDPSTRHATAKGMLAQARNFMRMRDNGFPEAFIRAKVDEVDGLAWMRDLTGPVQRQVRDILSSESLATHTEALKGIVGSGS